ncbi:MerR family transcriptional regulator [Vibrio cidicii]|nr:MerR family transcriptional regulator [Vibrio cidicii]
MVYKQTEEKLYAIREVAEMTGVKPVTLRAWQRRYNLVQPQRTEKGHRLYNEENLAMIREIQGWLAKGVAIGKVQALLGQAADISGLESQALDEVEAMLSALADLSAGKVESLLNTVLREYPFNVVCQQFLSPILQSVELVKNANRSLQKGLLRSILVRRLAAVLDAENKAASKGKCLIVSYESSDSLASWIEAVRLSDQGWHITLIDHVDDVSGLLQADVLAKYQRVHLFSNRALQEKQQAIIRQLQQQHSAVTLSEVLSKLHFEQENQ